MRIKIFSVLALATSILFISCKKELVPQDSSAAIQTQAPVEATNVPTLPPVANNTVAALPSSALNPAHGQPGHRCDIAVGAPLNTPATNKPTVQATAPSIQNSVTIPAQKPVVTAPGMNPPHGQPNHRCDIAVGAPLNSVVTKPAGSATISQSQTPPPASASPLPVANTTAPGMNPPHGQEGHKCDIAVGAPLPKE
ncbi:MAG: hypothetical protein PSV16_05990 [Flavobacterium sp.]|nr:hypothetical protein [Flavobacterium sp.]